MNHTVAAIVAVTLGLASPSLAADCAASTVHHVTERLTAENFSSKLLRKVHVKDLKAFDLVSWCKGEVGTGEIGRFSLSRWVGDQDRHVEYLTITFYEFPDSKARAGRVSEKGWPDSVADHNPDIDVYYFLVPGGTKLVRIERFLGYALG